MRAYSTQPLGQGSLRPRRAGGESRCEHQVAEGTVARHYHPTGETALHHLQRSEPVRARTDQGEDDGGTCVGKGEGKDGRKARQGQEDCRAGTHPLRLKSLLCR